MKYAELVKFEPIESVIQLRHANAPDAARRLVETFVISKRMAEQLGDVVFSHLQFTKPADTKGLLVVGNYGTGKSHVMAVISAVAERADLAPLLTHASVSDRAGSIAGRFQVIRAEIGSTTKSLRDSVCDVLEDGLSTLGISYVFPSASERHENKTAFHEMMAAFEKRYPDKGLLLVLDELLDYLKSRKDQELSLDLSFLREVGEVCKSTRFRFLSGVQESLFDNPRFQFVADTLRRVQARFEQVRIAREDIAFVVAERLLKKDARQRAQVREHLGQFTSLYGSMNERMEEFVQLFPVHPAYLDTFERVHVAEQREVLKTLSAAIRRLVDQDVPSREPGLIAYDDYWQTLKDNPSFRSVPEIREVIDRSGVLEARIQQAFTRPQYRPAALRVIHALSVHRLTTGDIYAPLGPTVEELRDDLCLLLPIPERDAAFLKTVVETVLKEVIKTVNGQFLSFNKENGQYYLDLKKDIDFDSLIEKKAEFLGEDVLNRYYFDGLRRILLEDPDAPPYVSGYRIWEHELEWTEHRAGRSGYLFFGAPNERCTAEPPRDFYLYFLQPFDPPGFAEERKSDEVFFRLRHRDETFDRALRLYGGALEQAAASSGSNKKIYEEKAAEHRQTLTTWLREHLTTSCDVGHQGRARSLAEVVRGKAVGDKGRASVRDLVNAAASICLGPHFQDRAPEYPVFSVLVTRLNRAQAAQEAVRWLSGSIRSKPGAAILDGLELLDGDILRPRQSRYARHILDSLGQKAHGQVLNRSELIQAEQGVDYWGRFRLEPEFLAVVLAALVHSGDLVVSLPGRKLDASAIDQFAKLPISDLTAFKHVERPKDLPLAPLQELFDLFGLPRGLIVNPAQREEAITQLQSQVLRCLERTVLVQSQLGEMTLWGKPLLSDPEEGDWRRQLSGLKAFLESLQAYNNQGRLKNFPYDVEAVAAQRTGLDRVREAEDLMKLVRQLGPLTAYLSKAEAVLPAEHAFAEAVRERRSELLARMASPKHRRDPGTQRAAGQVLAELKGRYQEAYLTAHSEARLGIGEDKKKALLSRDVRLQRLQKLAGIEMMPVQQLRELEGRLFGLKTCYSLTPKELEADPVCPHCSFRPVEERIVLRAPDVLASADARIDELMRDWTAALLAALADPTVAANIELLGATEGRRQVQAFQERREVPEPVTPAFVKALQEVLSGLEKVVFSGAALRNALATGGLPCTVIELQERFTRHVAEMTRGRDPGRVRILIEG